MSLWIAHESHDDDWQIKLLNTHKQLNMKNKNKKSHASQLTHTILSEWWHPVATQIKQNMQKCVQKACIFHKNAKQKIFRKMIVVFTVYIYFALLRFYWFSLHLFYLLLLFYVFRVHTAQCTHIFIVKWFILFSAFSSFLCLFSLFHTIGARKIAKWWYINSAIPFSPLNHYAHTHSPKLRQCEHNS